MRAVVARRIRNKIYGDYSIRVREHNSIFHRFVSYLGGKKDKDGKGEKYERIQILADNRRRSYQLAKKEHHLIKHITPHNPVILKAVRKRIALERKRLANA